MNDELRAAVLGLVDAVDDLPGWLPLTPVIALRVERVRAALKAAEDGEAATEEAERRPARP